MEIERARDDLVVAASAGATTVAIAVLSGVFGVVEIGTVLAIVPIAVYVVYLFSRKGGPYGSLDEPRNWAIAAALSGVVVVVAAAVL